MARRSERSPGGLSDSGVRTQKIHATGPLTALLVDDDEDLRTYLRRCLEHFGPLFGRVLEVSNGSEALSIAHSNAVDVLICGAQLPNMGSDALFSALRADPTTSSVLIMLVTDGDVEADRSPGSPTQLADTVLVSPFNAAAFADQLAELLRPG